MLFSYEILFVQLPLLAVKKIVQTISKRMEHGIVRVGVYSEFLRKIDQPMLLPLSIQALMRLDMLSGKMVTSL